MKRTIAQFLPGLLLPALLTMFHLSAWGQNLVMNPGFETGTTTGWFPFGSPTLTIETSQVHSGTYACQVANRTATYMGIAQSFVGVLQAGQTYNVSAWLRLVSGGSQTMQLTMQKIDGSGTNYTLITSGSVSSNAWTQLSGQYTYNPSGTPSTLTFYAEVPSSSTASYYIDDVNFSVPVIVTNPPINGVSVVDWNNVHQQIDGFGASSAYNGSWTTNQADILFSTNLNVVYSDNSNNNYTNNGIGLSLLRNHIVWANTALANDTPTTVETNIMQMAQARGARVWSTPWTPAAGFKSVNDIYDTNTATASGIDGGSFLGGDATNRAYASQLANYVASMKNTYNVNLYALSIQNEPDANVTTYDACQWTNTYIHDFVTNLYNALAAKGVGSTKIILPESQNWQDYKNLAGPAMTDPSVAADVSIIADHNYDGANGPASLIKNNYGKSLWETEVSQLGGETSDIGNGVYYAQRIYLFMTVAQASAWHYWWIIPYGSETGLMTQNAGPTKRMFTVGNYSRFVRPNNYRIDATSSQPSALISAYKATNSTAFAIVVVNTNAGTDVIQTFNLTNFTAATVTPWITSASLSLAPQTPVNITNASFTYDIPAMSVVTFAGQAAVAVANITISNVAYNPNGPAFVLTWNSSGGATYSVFKTNVLGGPVSNWPVIVTGYPAGGATGGTLSFTDTTATVSPAFYRVSSP
ncbi:MAG TPA: carbohydrate binding domain-containing protein [Candidatus Sulfopaludibacter sp.]|nr:carbohydrate binding domain-containing protein [Candidatus Sulfopaludibacter sp.]